MEFDGSRNYIVDNDYRCRCFNCSLCYYLPSGVISGSLNLIMSVSGLFLRFFLSNVVTFSVDGRVLLGMSKMVALFRSVFYFLI